MSYLVELAGWLATLEGGSPFTRMERGQDTLAKRVATLEKDIAGLEAMGNGDFQDGIQAARDLLRLLKGKA